MPATTTDSEPKTSVLVDPVTGKPVPMKDGKPCRVCTDFKTWSRIEKQKTKENKESDSGNAARAASAAGIATAATVAGAGAGAGAGASANMESKKGLQTEEEWRRQNCPADVETLGNATWTLLHTMAAYYPDRPAPSQMESMRSFFNSFAEHYPCWFCKDDFKKAIAEEPVQVGSRKKLSEWLCRRHNEVNEKLGKEQFDCTKVFERWLDGPPDGRCS